MLNQGFELALSTTNRPLFYTAVCSSEVLSTLKSALTCTILAIISSWASIICSTAIACRCRCAVCGCGPLCCSCGVEAQVGNAIGWGWFFIFATIFPWYYHVLLLYIGVQDCSACLTKSEVPRPPPPPPPPITKVPIAVCRFRSITFGFGFAATISATLAVLCSVFVILRYERAILHKQQRRNGATMQRHVGLTSTGRGEGGGRVVTGVLPTRLEHILISSVNSSPHEGSATRNDGRSYWFYSIDIDRDGFITGEEARHFFIKSQLPSDMLAQIWDSFPKRKPGHLDAEEFAHMFDECQKRKALLTSTFAESL